MNRKKSSAGFTLVEILLVVAIIGVLATIVVVRSGHHIDRTRRRAALVQIQGFKTSINLFELELARWPKNLEELIKEGDESWPGPFLESSIIPLDPWGNSYHYEIRGKRAYVSSPGPDGQLNTEDDVTPESETRSQ